MIQTMIKTWLASKHFSIQGMALPPHKSSCPATLVDPPVVEVEDAEVWRTKSHKQETTEPTQMKTWFCSTP